MSLYVKGNPENGTPSSLQGTSSPNPVSQKGLSAESSSSSSCTPHHSTTTVSAGGWFIDKTGKRDQENILIDLCEEDESAKSAVSVRLLITS